MFLYNQVYGCNSIYEFTMFCLYFDRTYTFTYNSKLTVKNETLREKR